MTDSIARLRKLAGLQSPPKVEVPAINAEVQDHKIVIDPKTGAPIVSDEKSITKSKSADENNKVPSPALKLNVKEDAPAPLASLTPQQTQAAIQVLSKALYGTAPTIAQQLGCTPQVAMQHIHNIASQNIASMTPTQAAPSAQPPAPQPTNGGSSSTTSNPQASTATPPAAVQSSTPTSGL